MRRPTLSYANMMSTLGVFIALGGTSYAVTKLPKNSVGTDQLRAAAVTNGKVADGAITPNKLAPGAAVAGPRGPRGEQGPSGSTGPAGPVDVIVRRHEGSIGFFLTAGSSLEALRTTLPAGKWWLHALVNVVNPGSGSTFRCFFELNGAAWGFDQATFLGKDITSAVTIPGVATANSAAPITVVLRCSHDAAISNTDPLPPRAERIRLTAIRATSLDFADQ